MSHVGSNGVEYFDTIDEVAAYAFRCVDDMRIARCVEYDDRDAALRAYDDDKRELAIQFLGAPRSAAMNRHDQRLALLHEWNDAIAAQDAAPFDDAPTANRLHAAYNAYQESPLT